MGSAPGPHEAESLNPCSSISAQQLAPLLNPTFADASALYGDPGASKPSQPPEPDALSVLVEVTGRAPAVASAAGVFRGTTREHGEHLEPDGSPISRHSGSRVVCHRLPTQRWRCHHRGKLTPSKRSLLRPEAIGKVYGQTRRVKVGGIHWHRMVMCEPE